MNTDSSRKLAEGCAIALLVTALIFGGGSRGIGDAVVHCIAALCLPIALMRIREVDWTRTNRYAAGLVIATFCVLALQCVPLPFELWKGLPARDVVRDGLNAAGVVPISRPLSLDPWGTVRGLLWLATGAVSWLLLAGLPTVSRMRWLQTAVLTAVLMTLLGYSQAMGGPGSGLQFHAFQNTLSATGTFANRNHFASFMGMTSVLAIGLAYVARAQRQQSAVVWAVAAVLLLLGAAVSFSRAGFVLAATGFSVALFFAWVSRQAKNTGTRGWGGLLATTGVLSLAGIGTYAWQRLLERFDRDPIADARFEYWSNGRPLFDAFAPWGTGAGGFRQAYGQMEPMGDLYSLYALHAHNDVVEVAIELGWPGIVLVLLAITLLVALCLSALRRRPESRLPIAWLVLALLIPLLHSLADYPLRTLAIWVLFCGAVPILAARKFPTGQSAAPAS